MADPVAVRTRTRPLSGLRFPVGLGWTGRQLPLWGFLLATAGLWGLFLLLMHLIGGVAWAAFGACGPFPPISLLIFSGFAATIVLLNVWVSRELRQPAGARRPESPADLRRGHQFPGLGIAGMAISGLMGVLSGLVGSYMVYRRACEIWERIHNTEPSLIDWVIWCIKGLPEELRALQGQAEHTLAVVCGNVPVTLVLVGLAVVIMWLTQRGERPLLRSTPRLVPGASGPPEATPPDG
jgi:hypothetical protein